MTQITQLDLNRGWYMSTVKKEGTPSGWIFTTFRGMSAWGDCDRMKSQDPGRCCSGGNCQPCPPVTCGLPVWTKDFELHHSGEYLAWLVKSDIPLKQKFEGTPGFLKLAIIGGGGLTLVIIGITAFTVIKNLRV